MATRTVKLFKIHSSVAFTIPFPAVPRLKLANGDWMLMYIDDDHINVMRMGPRDMKPEWLCEIRKLTYDGTTAKLILPASICKAFSLNVGDKLKIRIGKKPDGTEFIVLKPARPTLRIRMKHFDTESQLDVYRLTPEGDVDPNYAPVKKMISHSTRLKIENDMEEGNTDAVEKEIADDMKVPKYINMVVPDDYEPEVFLMEDELQAITAKEADESSDT